MKCKYMFLFPLKKLAHKGLIKRGPWRVEGWWGRFDNMIDCVFDGSWNSIFCNHLNTLRQRQNGCHFPDDMFKCIFLNELASKSKVIVLSTRNICVMNFCNYLVLLLTLVSSKVILLMFVLVDKYPGTRTGTVIF